ncbi:MAG TPA: hypothetical protein VJ507_00585 [Candidatus Bathyarchaeia archaeon]|nr:hypothetical protein [Candidatus Bathyarchaeia archaeon]
MNKENEKKPVNSAGYKPDPDINMAVTKADSADKWKPDSIIQMKLKEGVTKDEK